MVKHTLASSANLTVRSNQFVLISDSSAKDANRGEVSCVNRLCPAGALGILGLLGQLGLLLQACTGGAYPYMGLW